jgi:benzoyl-CoA reductase subunit C
MTTADTATTIDIFRAVLKDPSKIARDWKAQGKKVVGYRCLYVPEEIIHAADMLPYPIYGTPDPIGLADSYFQSCTCEFIRNIFDHALDGKLDFVDELVLANTCDVVRRLYDMWDTYIPSSDVYMVNNPQKLLDETNHAYYREELDRFRARMEELSDNKITDEKLQAAIDLYNETRTLLKDIYMLRKADTPPLSGEEVLDIVMAVTIMPKDQANPLLRQLLEELKGREVAERFGPRILITGSIIDNPALIRMVEEEGGTVVADDLCNTSRYFWHQADKDDDPMEALYKYLNKRPLCACMHPPEVRLEFLRELIAKFRVDAVIYFNLKYCHPFLYEAPLFQKELEAQGIPTNVLEVGHDMSGHGQLRTRIQAFIEMLELG